MTKYAVQPTMEERTFGEHELIVSKTDTIGHITYANDVFCRVALYKESDLIGKPHSVIRHPDMPRCVFKLLWDTIQRGEEIFAYVKNLASDGAYYWVLAHVTPSFDRAGKIVGYHSNRRCPERSAIARIEPVYRQLLAEEERYENRKEGMLAAAKTLANVLSQQSMAYDEYIFSLIQAA